MAFPKWFARACAFSKTGRPAATEAAIREGIASGQAGTLDLDAVVAEAERRARRD